MEDPARQPEAFRATDEGHLADGGTPRQRRRRELESVLRDAIDGARRDADFAYKVTLEPDDKLAGVRAAFKRVKERVSATEVNLVTVGSSLYIAKVPRRRGRRPKGR